MGSLIFVSGTSAADTAGTVLGLDDPYTQTHVILQRIAQALQDAGAQLADVVQTRVYVRDITRWEAIGRAHGEAFGAIRPATVMVEVSRLIDPATLVEIEAVAVIDGKAEEA